MHCGKIHVGLKSDLDLIFAPELASHFLKLAEFFSQQLYYKDQPIWVIYALWQMSGGHLSSGFDVIFM